MHATESHPVILDVAPLTASYIPEHMQGRDEQIREIAACLSPLLSGHAAIHNWAYGKPGTGKTSTVLHVLQDLRDKANLVTAVVNCWGKATFFEIIDELVTQQRILRAEQHRTSVKLDKLQRHLAGRPFLIVLDELDRMKPSERSGTVYNLASLPNVGLICISDSQHALFELDERARSRLNPRTVRFPAYSTSDLKGVLTFRAEISLVPGSWSERGLARIARAAAGDARIAIGALRAAAELAEVHQHGRLSLNGVERRCRATAAARQAQLLNSLTPDHRILYELVKRDKQLISSELWARYVRRCQALRRKALAPRTFSNYANRLVEVGLLASERARVKGRVRLFKIVEGARGQEVPCRSTRRTAQAGNAGSA